MYAVAVCSPNTGMTSASTTWDSITWYLPSYSTATWLLPNAIFCIPTLIFLTVSSIQGIVSYQVHCLLFVQNFELAELISAARQISVSSPRSVLLLLEVVLSLSHHLCHKQSDHGSIHFSNHRIHILPPCYSKSVTYASIESPSSWFLEKNECLSNKRRSNKAAFDGSKWEKFAEIGDL